MFLLPLFVDMDLSRRISKLSPRTTEADETADFHRRH